MDYNDVYIIGKKYIEAKNKLYNVKVFFILIIVVNILLLFISMWFVVTLFATFFAFGNVYYKCIEANGIGLKYELSDSDMALYKKRISVLDKLQESYCKWAMGDSSTYLMPKYNAGVDRLANRYVLSFYKTKVHTPFISNVDFICIKDKKITLLFLPDMILYCTESNVKSIDWSELELKIENEFEIVENTVLDKNTESYKQYKYVNKDGSRDRRFNNNPQVNVCTYGSFRLTISTINYNRIIAVSDVKKTRSINKEYSNEKIKFDR